MNVLEIRTHVKRRRLKPDYLQAFNINCILCAAAPHEVTILPLKSDKIDMSPSAMTHKDDRSSGTARCSGFFFFFSKNSAPIVASFLDKTTTCCGVSRNLRPRKHRPQTSDLENTDFRPQTSKTQTSKTETPRKHRPSKN